MLDELFGTVVEDFDEKGNPMPPVALTSYVSIVGDSDADEVCARVLHGLKSVVELSLIDEATRQSLGSLGGADALGGLGG